MMDKLDFIVIGAAKSGTTTLFELMNQHPDIQMPTDKEAPYYTEPSQLSKGLDWYINNHFDTTKQEALNGTITPQYMLGKEDINPEDVAQKIYHDFPRIKLLAILRHPIERAYSHHKMLKQRGVVPDGFQEITTRLLSDENELNTLRHEGIMPSNVFITGSEYGRILSYYYNTFGSSQMLVVFLDDLQSAPDATLNQIFNFIGADPSFMPKNLDVQARKGGSKAKINLLTPGVLYKIPLLKKSWNKIMPPVIRKKIEYRINLWNIKPDNSSLEKSDEAYEKLIDFFRDDIKLLESLIGKRVPWSDWH